MRTLWNFVERRLPSLQRRKKCIYVSCLQHQRRVSRGPCPCSVNRWEVESSPLISFTGLVYERRLLTQYVEEHNGLCPETGEPLDIHSVISVKTSPVVKPRPPRAASIPGMLGLLQQEWDALMNETFLLRQHLDTARNQLSQSLYQHDAACRVIAKLIRERDSAMAQVDSLKQQLMTLKESGAVAGPQGLPSTFLEELAEVSARLTQARRKRQVSDVTEPSRWSSPESGGEFQVHQTAADVAGVTNVKVIVNDTLSGSPVSLSCGRDGGVVLFDLAERHVLCSLLGHTRTATSAVVHRSLPVVASASADRTIRIWSGRKSGRWDFRTSHVLRTHTAEVSSLDLHCMGTVLVSSGKSSHLPLFTLPRPRSFSRVARYGGGLIVAAL